MKGDIKPSYMQRLERHKTWSGIPTKDYYKHDDVKENDDRQHSSPGEYPYTRGIHQNMYRGRIWTIREISGRCTPEKTNQQMKSLIAHGETGLNVIPDLPFQLGIDGDHPFSAGDVGVQGVPNNTLSDMEKMMDGLDQEEISMTFSTIWPTLQANYIALAQKRNADISKLRGTYLNDVLHSVACGHAPHSPPLDMGFKVAIDCAEYSIKRMPNWYPLCFDSYDLREHGISAAQEIAFIFSIATANIDALLERGLDIDEIAPKISYTMSAHLDIFEEAAKFRAARRLWARLMKEKYGAKHPKSMKMKFHCNTAGSGTFRPQPLNNLNRVALMALSAVLGGCQSLQCVRFDEPIGLPTDLSDRLAVRTQQIILYESGVANVADPLGGSYYVEHLTDMLEDEMQHIIDEIDQKQGGGYQISVNGWLRTQLDEAAYHHQMEIESGERIIVGQNAFQISAEEEEKEELTGIPVSTIDDEAISQYLDDLKRLKRTRDQPSLKKAIDALRSVSQDQDKNCFPAIIDACRAYASLGEIDGILREAWGYDYDPFTMIANPFH